MNPADRIHFAIAVYDNHRPPLGTPQWVPLCIDGRVRREQSSRLVDLVNCPVCLKYVRELGL